MARSIVRGLCGALAAAGLVAAGVQASAQANTVARPPSPPAAAAAAPPSQEIFITMRDGTKLAANVYLPNGKGPWPVVLMRTPYIKDNGFWGAGASLFTDAGYVYVIQDVRGKGHSQGHYDAFFNDTEDGYDTVEALAAEPWSNGQIGMTGASAMGITATQAAIAAPPHLKAAYVVVTPSERFTTSFLGGVLKEKDTVGWMKGQGESDDAIAAAEAGAIRSAFTDRQAGANLKYIRIPIYSVGGWYDIFNTGTIANFEYLQNHGARGARGNQKLRMGPFGHGPLSGGLAYPGEDSLSLQSADEIRWFDYWLKGIDNGIMDEPPVDAFMMASAEPAAPRSSLLSDAGPRARLDGAEDRVRQDFLPLRSGASRAHHRRRQPDLRARADGPAPDPGTGRLPPLPDPGARPRRDDRRPGQGGALRCDRRT